MSGESFFYTRHHWNALPPRRTVQLDVPVSNVVTLWSDTDPCYTAKECMKVLQDLQKKHLSEKLSDIQISTLAVMGTYTKAVVFTINVLTTLRSKANLRS